MPQDIESLQIQINAEAKSANDAIDRLVGKLDKLSASLGKFNGSKFSGLTSELRGISTALGGIGKESTSGLSAIANGLSRLDKIDPGKITAVSDSLTRLAGGLNIANGVTFESSGLVNAINSISKLGGKYATQAAQNLETIKTDVVSFVNGLNSVAGITFDSNSLSEFAVSLNRLGGKMATQAAANLKPLKDQLLNFVSGLNAVGKINFDMTGLADLANGIARLGGKAATQAIANIPQLASAMDNLMRVLSKAPAVSQNIINMTNALANLAKTGSSSGRAANALAGSLNTYTRSTSSASNGTKGLASALGKLYATYWLVFRAVGKLRDAINISSSLTEVQNVVDVTFGRMSYKVDEFAKKSIEQFGMSELSLKQYASRFQAMGTAMNIDTSSIENANKFLNQQTGGYIGLSDSMSDVSLNLTKLTADMASFYNMSQEDVAKDLESVFTGMTRPLRAYGLDLTEATLSEWAMKNGLDANIKSMTQAEKTMLRYQYVLANSTAAQGDFERTQNTWANQTRILRQQLEQLASVIGGTLINALKPLVSAFNVAMKSIIAFAQTISNALGKIFGWKYEGGTGGFAQDFGDAAGSAEDIESGMSGAADSAKKMKTHLLAIDELNVREPDEGDSGSGGKGGGDLGGAGFLPPDDIEGGWERTESLFESNIDNLYDLGAYIGDVLKKALRGIDWESVYEGARNFGKGLADFLNGLISPELFAEVGRTIAGALNTALYALNSFGKTFEWKNFGLSIATGINEFFGTFDFNLLADTINVWAHGILDTIIEFLDKTNWELIGTKIGEFLAGLDFVGVGKKVATAIWKAISAAFKVFASSFKVAPIETLITTLAVAPTLLKKIANSKFAKEIANLAKNFLHLSTNAKLFVTSLAGNQDSIQVLMGQFPRLGKAVDVARQAIANFQFGLENGNFLTGLNDGITTIRNNLTGFQKGLIGVGFVLGEFFLLKDGFYDIASGADNLVASIGKIAAGAGIASAALYTAFGPAGLVVAGITAVVSAISGINKAFEEIRAAEIGESIKKALSSPGGTPLSEVTTQFSSAIEGIGESFNAITEKAVGLDQADANIKNVWLEIEKIETSMDAGVISVEEGTAELSRLFGELAQTANEKFTALEDTLLVAFGENGVLAGTFQRLGISTENTTETIIQLNDKVQKRIEELANLLSQTDPSNPNYAAYKEELAGLMTQTDELTKAVSNYDFALENIDYSNLILEDGSLDTTALQEFLDELKSATETANTDIENAIKSTREALENEKTMAESVGDWVAAEEIQTKIDALPQALELLKGDVSLKAAELTDTVQKDFIGSMNSVIESAKTEWGEQGFWASLWSGFSGTMTEGSYVKEAVDQQQTNIETLSSAIETSLSDLKVENIGWASEAGKEIVDSLFDSKYVSTPSGLGEYQYALKSNYEEIINGATEGISELAGDRGKDTVEGFNNGITDNLSTTITAIHDWMTKADKEGIHDSALRFGSPSQTAEDYGKDTVEGYNLGITENAQSSIDAVTEWATQILNAMKTALGIADDSGMTDSTTSMFGGLVNNFISTWEIFSETWTASLEEWSAQNTELYFGEEVWNNNWMNLYNTYIKVWGDFTKIWKKNFDNWWKIQIIPYFSVKQWTEFGTNMKNGIMAGFKSIVNEIGGVLNNLIAVFDSAFSKLEKSMNQLIKDYNKAADKMGTSPLSSVHYERMGKISVPAFAVGGFPEDGLFMANRGELVGRFANGRTAVANNEMITAGIEEAAYRGFSRAYSENTREASLLEELIYAVREGKEITIDGRSLVEAYDSRKARNGYSFT